MAGRENALASSKELIGRLEFVLRLVSITALGLVFELLLRRRVLSAIGFTSSEILQGAIFGLVGMYSVRAIDSRLQDAQLPRWYRYPAFSVWLLSTSLPFFWTRTWPLDLSLFLLLLIALAVPASRSLAKEDESKVAMSESQQKKTPRKPAIPPRMLVGQVGFLRSLLTFGCLGFPLIWLETSSGIKLGALTADVGFAILCFVWAMKVLGRFADWGKAANWYWLVFCIAAMSVAELPLRFKVFNRYEALAFFLIIQLPLASLSSDPRIVRPARKKRRGEIDSERYLKEHPNAKRLMVSQYSFLRRLSVIALLWAMLIYFQTASGSDEIALFFVSCGYFVVGFAWIMNASGRFTDAGLAHGWYTLQFFLVVSVASLMPLLVHWVNGYEALAIFFLIQIPMVIFPSKPHANERTAT